MHTGMCYYCNREVEMKLLKKCGACGAVTYCSKECQKRAWKTSHKYNCTPNLPPAGEADPSKPYNKIISAWQNEWKVVLDAFAVLALDLENNPEKNATHCMWLEFKYIGGGANSGKFRITSAALRTKKEVLAEDPRLHIMRETPSLVGKQARYAMMFHFEEEGKPTQSFLRVRALLLNQKTIEVLRGGPVGWGNVCTTILQTFGSPGEPMVAYDVPMGQ